MDPLPPDLVDFLMSCNLDERKLLNIQKNMGNVLAPGIIIVEIIHSHYPKLIQVSFTWKLLQLLHCYN